MWSGISLFLSLASTLNQLILVLKSKLKKSCLWKLLKKRNWNGQASFLKYWNQNLSTIFDQIFYNWHVSFVGDQVEGCLVFQISYIDVQFDMFNEIFDDLWIVTFLNSQMKTGITQAVSSLDICSFLEKKL